MHSTLTRDSYSDYYKSDMMSGVNGNGGMAVPQLRYDSPYLYYKQWRQSNAHNDAFDDDSNLLDSSRYLAISLTIIGIAN